MFGWRIPYVSSIVRETFTFNDLHKRIIAKKTNDESLMKLILHCESEMQKNQKMLEEILEFNLSTKK